MTGHVLLRVCKVKQTVPDICFACQIRALHSIPNNIRSGRRRHFNSAKITTRPRSFSRSSAKYATETTVTSDSVAGVPEYNFTVKRPDKLAGLRASRKDVQASSIRRSLKAWSAQNTVLRNQNTLDDLPSEGRITQLPNALFAGRHSSDQKDADQGDSVDTLLGDVDRAWLAGSEHLMQPGTLFSLQHDIGRSQFAVYMGEVGNLSLLAIDSGMWSLQSVSSARKAAVARLRLLNVAGFLSHDEMEHLKKFMPKEPVTRLSAGTGAPVDMPIKGPMPADEIGPFMSKIGGFRHEVDELERKFKSDIEIAKRKCAHETEYTFMTIDEYVAKGLGLEWQSLSNPSKMAVLSILDVSDDATITSTAETVSVLLMPRALKESSEKVVTWARDYQDAAARAATGKDVTEALRRNPLTSFIDKARRLIVSSRKTRALPRISLLGPSLARTEEGEFHMKREPTGILFSKEDRMFIDFLWTASMRKPEPFGDGPLKIASISALILRAVGAYPERPLDLSTARLLLREIGCVDPWTSTSSIDLLLPHSGSRALHRGDQLAPDLSSFRQKLQELVQEGRFQELDSMAHLRRDWGSLPAFAIDFSSKTAAEDAISIEPAADMTNCHWIHVHTSHPSAFFGRDSIIDRVARFRGSSCYSIDGILSLNMMPSEAIRMLSINEGSPVITMSTLIGEDGTVLDVKASVGTLGTVVAVQNTTVSEIVGLPLDTEDEFSAIVVGKVSSLPRYQAPRNKAAWKHQQALKTLHSVLQKRLQRREQELPRKFQPDGYEFVTSLSTTQLPIPEKDREHRSMFWRGDPGIALVAKQVATRRDLVTRATDIVAQAMRLAGESAGRWCSERHISTVFLGTLDTPKAYESPIAENDSAHPAPTLHVRSATPIPHWKLHMKQYGTWTSPLRKYPDFLLQHQVGSYLRAEAEGRIDAGAPVEDESILAFSQADVEEYLKVDATAIDTVDQVARSVKEDLGMQALSRAFYFQEASLPETWEMLIYEPVQIEADGFEREARGVLVPFGFRCTLKRSEQGWERRAARLQFIKVKLDLVDSDRRRVECTAISAATDEQTLKDTFQCHRPDNFGKDVMVHPDAHRSIDSTG